jgi:OmpA-OmpF porin, OOP family
MTYSTWLALGLVMIGGGLEASSARAQTSPVPGAVQPQSGPYLSLGAGANFAGSPLSENGLTKVNTEAGQVGTAAFGWATDIGLRAEIEGSYRANDVGGISTHRVNGQLVPLTNVGGDVATEAVMANFLYDLPVRGFGLPFQPYIGGGAGYEWSQFNTSGNGFSEIAFPRDGIIVIGPNDIRQGDASAFAYQAIAGMSLPLQFMLPRLSATLEYRFFGTATEDVPITRTIHGITVNGVVPSATTTNPFELHENTLMLGLRYSLGGP